jgi:hypothetical protein
MPEAAKASLAMPTIEAVPASPARPSGFERRNHLKGASYAYVPGAADA